MDARSPSLPPRARRRRGRLASPHQRRRGDQRGGADETVQELDKQRGGAGARRGLQRWWPPVIGDDMAIGMGATATTTCSSGGGPCRSAAWLDLARAWPCEGMAGGGA
jgi:hypothetical protein